MNYGIIWHSFFFLQCSSPRDFWLPSHHSSSQGYCTIMTAVPSRGTPTSPWRTHQKTLPIKSAGKTKPSYSQLYDQNIIFVTRRVRLHPDTGRILFLALFLVLDKGSDVWSHNVILFFSPRKMAFSLLFSSSFARYQDYRDDEGNHTIFYYRLLALRLGFVIVFEVNQKLSLHQTFKDCFKF